LVKIPMVTSSWASFQEAHPDGTVLTTDTGFNRAYGQNPYPGYDDVNTSPFLFRGETDGRLAAKERVLAVRGDESVVITFEFLQEERVVPITLDGESVVAFWLGGTSSALQTADVDFGRDIGSTGAFIAEADGQPLTFSASDDGFVDEETGSTWNIFGTATAGPLEGTQLQGVEHLDTFWFAIAAFSPDSTIIGA
jgi:hypothetical protein